METLCIDLLVKQSLPKQAALRSSGMAVKSALDQIVLYRIVFTNFVFHFQCVELSGTTEEVTLLD